MAMNGVKAQVRGSYSRPRSPRAINFIATWSIYASLEKSNPPILIRQPGSLARMAGSMLSSITVRHLVRLARVALMYRMYPNLVNRGPYNTTLRPDCVDASLLLRGVRLWPWTCPASMRKRSPGALKTQIMPDLRALTHTV